MELSPRIYHLLVRPRLLTKIYIHNIVKPNFNFDNKTVLDFGSGIGANCSMFTADQYLGVDPDRRRISYAKTLYPNYSFRVLEDKHLPFANDSVDYILIIAVLHHIPPYDLPAYLQEFRRILNPLGKIIVMEPCFLNQSSFTNRFMKFFDKGKYIQNEDGYIKIFKQNHYRIEKLQLFRKMLFYNEVFFSAAPE